MPCQTIIVVPCYNEAERLDCELFVGFAEKYPDIGFVLVDDGSTDATLSVLEALATDLREQVRVVPQTPNQGKAEAVRLGMLRAFDTECRYAGYWDADLATPLDAIPDFVAVLERQPDLEIVFGSRVKLLGRSVERKLSRHYLGRVFATAASSALRLAIYDTQCGAKLFRNTPESRALFAEPFLSSWIFDVELLARLIAARRGAELPQPEQIIYELPLQRWQDVHGSKVTAWDFPRALVELVRIYWRYLRRRR